jgi:hypothetical protein
MQAPIRKSLAEPMWRFVDGDTMMPVKQASRQAGRIVAALGKSTLAGLCPAAKAGIGCR